MRLPFLMKIKVLRPERCVECHDPLGIPQMGGTLRGERGAVHKLCVPTVVRMEGPDAVQEWLDQVPANA